MSKTSGRKKLSPKSCSAAIVLAILACLLGKPGIAAAQENSPSSSVVPRLVNFSGVVKDSAGTPVLGSATITFSLHELQEGGSPLWVETQTVQTDSEGHYTALLGSNSPDGLPLDLFTSGSARWLGIAPAIPGLGELPRVLLVGVPYALKAADAETLGGKPASSHMLNPENNVGIGSAIGAIAGSSPGASAPNKTENSKGKAKPETATGQINYVAKFTDSKDDLGDSEIYDTGSKVGIGTTTPAATLDVNGSFNLPATTSTSTGLMTLGGIPFVQACCPSSAGNTFVGYAGNFSANASTSNAGDGWNTGVGWSALWNLTTGFSNTAIGGGALKYNTSGFLNTAVGLNALLANTSGWSDTANGAFALEYNTSGTNNTALGYGSLFANTTGASNTATGYQALNSNNTAGGNTADGLAARGRNGVFLDSRKRAVCGVGKPRVRFETFGRSLRG